MTTAETEVRAVLGRLTEAWNDGDATAYGRLFTEDADYVTFFGLNFPGREAIESSHRALFEGPLKGSKLTGQLGAAAKVRFVRSEEHTSELQAHVNLVCRLLLEKKKTLRA